jgi:hypothetical protein
MALFSGQQNVGVAAANLGSNAASNVIIRAFGTNTIPVFIGASGVTTGSGYELPPGHSTPALSLTNSNLVYTIATATGAKVCFIGT